MVHSRAGSYRRSRCRSTFTSLAPCSMVTSSVASSKPCSFIARKKMGASSRRGSAKIASPPGASSRRYEVGEGGRVLTLVEDVRSEDEVEASRYPLCPVRASRGWRRSGSQVQVSAGVVGGEVEGGLVVVRSEDFCAAGRARRMVGNPTPHPSSITRVLPRSCSERWRASATALGQSSAQ